MAKLKQCIQSLATRLQSPEGAMGATMMLREGYPCLEPLVNLSDPTRKLLAAYDTVSDGGGGSGGVHRTCQSLTFLTFLFFAE